MSLLLKGVRLLDAEGLSHRRHNVLIDRGLIAAVEPESVTLEADRSLDAPDQWLLPGLVDLACRPRNTGQALKDVLSAGAAGGYSLLCLLPDRDLAVDSAPVVSLLLDKSREAGLVQVRPVGAVTRGLAGDRLSDMATLAGAGCVALSDGGCGTADARVMRRCMAYAATFGLPLFLQPENKSLAEHGCVHEGTVGTRLGLPGIPAVAETTAVAELLLLAEETGVALHLGQLTTARAVEMVSRARAQGLAVTADVALANLLFTEDAVSGYDSRFHLRPPLRTAEDREALRAGIREGVLDAVVSHHWPPGGEDKRAPFGETRPGLATLSRVLPAMAGLVEEGIFSAGTLVRGLCHGPTAVLGLPAPTLRVGAQANCCLFDPQAADSVAADEAVPGRGRVRLNLLQGRPIHADSE